MLVKISERLYIDHSDIKAILQTGETTSVFCYSDFDPFIVQTQDINMGDVVEAINWAKTVEG